MTLLDSIEYEAAEANRAAPLLRDDPVAEALRLAASLVRMKRTAILEANASDVASAADRLDEGGLDRLRLDFGHWARAVRDARARTGVRASKRRGVRRRAPSP